ncbi:MAG: phosphopantothenoylcysteine decarboxylase [Endomicrobium sp.]|uniref:phosphopantothenoylcysteine decarboxylase domain-containing protein n=1 Tax=Candidatus Endomicrobiellum pyrsonymphae TaxID=1408203 RepID=UPI00357D8057|nr:phosphopantothenoylcysteine decarboxylase [Endomicrobium sp.]
MSTRLTFLILSGPTKEYIDPVRYISNESSGKMGKALAEAVLEKDHKVIFVSGHVNVLPKNVKLIKVISALEMLEAVKANLKKSDVIISAAAVADYRPAKICKHKIKKSYSTSYETIELRRNPDIVKYCADHKTNQVVVGFALETCDILKNAKLKLKKKNLDLIIANGKESFGSDSATVHVISADGILKMKNKNKKIIARRIINETIRIFQNIKVDKKIS